MRRAIAAAAKHYGKDGCRRAALWEGDRGSREGLGGKEVDCVAGPFNKRTLY